MVSRDVALNLLFVTRLAFPVILLAVSLSVLTLKRPSSRIRLYEASETIIAWQPRRGLILAIFPLVALTYFTDGFVLVLHSVISKTWQGTPEHGLWWRTQQSGLDVESVVGLLASGLLATLGLWKDHQNVVVWTTWRPILWTIMALVGSLIEFSLEMAMPANHPSSNIPKVVHTVILLLRAFLLLVLYAVLSSPIAKHELAAMISSTEGCVDSVSASTNTTPASESSSSTSSQTNAPSEAHGTEAVSIEVGLRI